MLVCLLQVWLAAGAGDATTGAAVASDRIESITIDAAGQGATVVTRAIALDGGRASYELGGRACRDHKVDPIVLTQMFEAMRARHGVRVVGKSVGQGERAVQCMAAISFFAADA